MPEKRAQPILEVPNKTQERFQRQEQTIADLEQELQELRFQLKAVGIDPTLLLRNPRRALKRAGVDDNSIHLNYTGVEKKGKLSFRTAAQISREGIPPTEWHIPNLLPKECLALLTGIAKGGGKTTFAVGMAKALLTDDKFLNRLSDFTPVVYLTEQADKAFFNEYLTPAKIHESEDLHLLHGHECADMKWEEIIAGAVEHALSVGAECMFIDTFMHFAGLSGEQENSSSAIQSAMKPLQHAVAKWGLTIVVVHHDRKGGGDVFTSTRGSSAFQGAADLIINLQRPAGGHRDTVRELRSTGRYSDVPDRLMVEMVDTFRGRTYDSLGSKEKLEKEIAEELALKVAPTEQDGALRRSELLDAVREENDDVARATFDRAVKRLTSQGRLRCEGDGVKGDPYRYWRPLE